MFRSFSLVLLAISLTTPAIAADPGDSKPGKGPAFTAPPADDPNYPLLGEFLGEIKNGDGEPETLGLQIRPVGGDNFDAMSFVGGLPGQEKHKPEPIRLIGRRSDDLVILSGGPWAMFVTSDSCTLIDRTGEKVGTLERIKRSSPTMHAPAPEGATVLFDGTGTDQFTKAEMTKDGLLMQGADVRPMFQDFNMHVEFRLPYMPQADGQSRGNSGLYLQGRYECQVLDSFAQDAVFNGLGALYRFKKPDVNMCLPPLVWQTYDVQFTAPRWAADGTKIRDAHITSWVNGVKVQDNVALPTKTGAGKPEEPVLLPTKIQDHGDPVRFRNIWVVDRGLIQPAFPIEPTPEQLAASETKRRKEKGEASAAKAKAKMAAMKEQFEAERAAAEKTKEDAEKAEAGQAIADAEKSSEEPKMKADEKADEKKDDAKKDDDKKDDAKKDDDKKDDQP